MKSTIGLISSLCFVAAPFGTAAAHTLPADTALAGQLAHWLLSLHHMPVILAILVVAAILYRKKIAVFRR